MEKETILNELDELLIEGNSILSTKWTESMGIYTYVDEENYYSWRTKVLSFLKLFLSIESDYMNVFSELSESSFSNANICVQTLQNIKEYIKKNYISIEQKNNIKIDEILDLIFTRFHKIARQLQSRYNHRDTLTIDDEYDVQDLLHALLQLYFDDIRAEEWTPSYAGKCARVDFLLKNEKIVIEVKKTRKGLTDKEIGDQLIVDIDRYKSHADCQKLICFVYDPEARIGNPIGIMKDLNTQHNGFVTVYIRSLI